MSEVAPAPVDRPDGRDPSAGRSPFAAPGLLATFADAGVVEAADVHVATTLHRLADADTDPTVVLAIALTVRAVRHGSVHVDLATVADTIAVDDAAVSVADLSWPDAEAWVAEVARHPLVAVGDDEDTSLSGGDGYPLRLLGSELSLDRYWRHERSIAADLLRRLVAPAPEAVDLDVLDDGLSRLFPATDDAPDRQRRAARTAIDGALAVIAGGPGTGKTTTVAAVLALLCEQATARGHRMPRVALAAPTGKAAARLTEAVHDRARHLRAAGTVDHDVADELLGVEAATLHRLLGRLPGSSSRFRHDRANQLPHDVVIVDESSMVSLSLMSRLLEAVGPAARLVLVGDPRQLASVEAGAVLGDIVGPAASATGALAERIVVLDRVHRFDGGVGEVARAIESGDADTVLELLAAQPEGIRWLPTDDTARQVRAEVVAVARRVVAAARAGDAGEALQAMADVQILCAHRRGPAGVGAWRRLVERWLTEDIDGYSPHGWFAGRPVLITANDYSLDLFNGDTGVAVQDPTTGDEQLRCAFARRGDILQVSPSRLRAVETMYAMTIHKSQGSQFRHVIVVLPPVDSPILTRELLYTAVTRAERQVTLIGSPDAVADAVARPVQRASGLRHRLWRPDA